MKKVAVLALVTVVACSRGHCSGGEPGPFRFGASVRIDGHIFLSEVADEVDEQQVGLMHRTELAPNGGMLFLWDDVQVRSFYMKDTLIPLDLIAIKDGRVVSVATMVPCEQTPCVNTRTAEAEAAIEINGGRASKLGIDVGDRATFESNGCD